MHIVQGYPDGVFCWVDLSTPDPEKAKRFYGGLFGWEFKDEPTDMGTLYTMCQIDGYNVAGLGPQSPEMVEQGVPAIWTSYVKHADVDAVAARVTEAGGNLMLPPMDVMETGRMAIASDPSGASFGIWQPKSHLGAQVVNAPNALIWNELQTRDSEAAKAHYGKVFGWTFQVDANGYITCLANERVQAGIITMGENWSAEVPPNWTVYFMVEEVEPYVEKAEALGGSVRVPLTEAGEMGRFAVLSDPQGGVFTVMSFSGPVDLPPGVKAG